MKRIAALILLAVLALTGTLQAQRISPEENARQSRKAAKKQQQFLNKSNKNQRKAMKKYEKQQRKATKKANQRLKKQRSV
jgi:nitrate reductase cytochrome c-type subunit